MCNRLNPSKLLQREPSLKWMMLLIVCCSSAQLTAQRARSLDQQLFAAIGNRDLVAAEHLLREGANIEATTTNGVTPLMSAAETGDVPIISLLLEHGANPRARNNQDETALVHAARGGWVNAVNLLARLADTKQKNLALIWAVEGGPVVVKEVVDAPGPPVPMQNPTAYVEESWTATVEALLDSGADIEARDPDGSTPLLPAAAFAQTDVFKLLLRRGARVDVRDKDGNTPLIAASCECAVATMNDAYDVVKLLLEKGSDVNARASNGTTALMNAAGGFGGSAIVKLLLEHGADPRARDAQGKTALEYASDRPDKALLIRKALAAHRH